MSAIPAFLQRKWRIVTVSDTGLTLTTELVDYISNDGKFTLANIQNLNLVDFDSTVTNDKKIETRTCLCIMPLFYITANDPSINAIISTNRINPIRIIPNIEDENEEEVDDYKTEQITKVENAYETEDAYEPKEEEEVEQEINRKCTKKSTEKKSTDKEKPTDKFINDEVIVDILDKSIGEKIK